MYNIEMYDVSSMNWTVIYSTDDNNIALYMYYQFLKKYKKYIIRVVEIQQCNEGLIC